MKGVRVEAARGFAVAVCVCISLLTALIPLTPAPRAQSGRNRNTPPATGKETTRPRTVTTSAPASQPAATPTPTANEDATDAPAGKVRGASRSSTTGAGDARPGAPEGVGEDDVVRISSNLVPLPAFVTDAQGRFVSDLQLKDFELLVDDQPRPIAELTRAETPIKMVMLFDNSSSLRAAAARRFEKEAAAGFFRNVMRPVDRAALVSIWTVPQLAQPLTNDVGALVRAVEGFDKPEGATALFDSIAYAAEYLRLHRGRKVLVIVSDGTDTVSELGFDSTLAIALALNCQIYAVRTGHSENTNLRDLAGERRLQEFAARTGGAVYVPRTRAELRQAFAQIAADLSQQYVLSYYPADDQPDGRFRAFTLRVGTRPGLQVRTRKGYYAPKK